MVLVDDGSEPPLEKPATSLNVKVVRQERRGFGLARARNAGVRAAAHDVLLFLDSDVLVENCWMAAHARWHHAVSDVVTIGHVAHVRMDGIDPEAIRRRRGALKELFADRATRNPGIEGHLAGTGNLTSRRDDPFRMTSGGNLGVGREYYELVGGYDESFTRWGFEDVPSSATGRTAAAGCWRRNRTPSRGTRASGARKGTPRRGVISSSAGRWRT